MKNPCSGFSCGVIYLLGLLLVKGCSGCVSRFNPAHVMTTGPAGRNVDPWLMAKSMAYLAKAKLKMEALDRDSSHLMRPLRRLETRDPNDVVVASAGEFSVAGLEVLKLQERLSVNQQEARRLAKDATRLLSDAGLGGDPACASALHDINSHVASILATTAGRDLREASDGQAALAALCGLDPGDLRDGDLDGLADACREQIARNEAEGSASPDPRRQEDEARLIVRILDWKTAQQLR